MSDATGSAQPFDGNLLAIDRKRFWDDASYRGRVARGNKPLVADLLMEMYPLVSRQYIIDYLDHLVVEGHIENPLATLYLDTELGAPGKYMELVEHLAGAGYDIAGRSCLDIGCGNGALALACLHYGASDAMAVDVSLDRLSSAKRLCAGSGVRFRVVDMVEERLGEEFDAIFCMDVLEHVPSAENLIAKIGRSLRRGPSSFAYVTLFNHNFMPNVLSEPHFSVPGLVRVPSDTAWSLWEEIRPHYQSTLSYDVFDWFDYEEYVGMAERAGMRLDPVEIDGVTLRACADSAAEYAEAASGFRIDFSMRLASLPVAADTRRVLEAHVEDYLDQFNRDHEAVDLEDHDALMRLYHKYYAQPLTMILKPDDAREVVAPASAIGRG